MLEPVIRGDHGSFSSRYRYAPLPKENGGIARGRPGEGMCKGARGEEQSPN